MKIGIGIGAILFIILVWYTLTHPEPTLQHKEPLWGFSYSPKQAERWNLDWKESYVFLLDELRPQSIRIPLYWDETEKEPGVLSFERVEFLLREAKKRNIPVVLNIGYRVFRYPECHVPEWVQQRTPQQFEEALLSYLGHVINYLSKSTLKGTLEAIQIENEARNELQKQCPPTPYTLLEKEVVIVKDTFPDMPVVLTWAGDLPPSDYKTYIRYGDIVAASFFPRRWNHVLYLYDEVFSWGILSIRHIGRERAAAESIGKQFWISEFEAEPWGEENETATPERITRYKKLLDSFGGTERVYLWGAEWWAWKAKQGDTRILSFIKELTKGNKEGVE